MLDRAIYESQLRKEMVVSVLLSSKIRAAQREANKQVVNATGGENDRRGQASVRSKRLCSPQNDAGWGLKLSPVLKKFLLVFLMISVLAGSTLTMKSRNPKPFVFLAGCAAL